MNEQRIGILLDGSTFAAPGSPPCAKVIEQGEDGIWRVESWPMHLVDAQTRITKPKGKSWNEP
jgi:hypothetical protein